MTHQKVLKGKKKKPEANIWSDIGALPPTLADFLNWMLSNETQDDGENEDIQESAEAAFAAPSQGTQLSPQRLMSYTLC
jgi:hypothetical protein